MPLHISTVGLGGFNPLDFRIEADNCTGATIAVNNTCTVQVSFWPILPGARSASLDVTSDSAAGVDSEPLDGNGVFPLVWMSRALAQLE
jgi:hypothetical protein